MLHSFCPLQWYWGAWHLNTAFPSLLPTSWLYPDLSEWSSLTLTSQSTSSAAASSTQTCFPCVSQPWPPSRPALLPISALWPQFPSLPHLNPMTPALSCCPFHTLELSCSSFLSPVPWPQSFPPRSPDSAAPLPILSVPHLFTSAARSNSLYKLGINHCLLHWLLHPSACVHVSSGSLRAGNKPLSRPCLPL